MSKKNLLLGTAAGKVGDLVFYRAGGEQRTRAKVTPANPKTYAQQAQRSRMANVTLMYRALAALCKDSFVTRKVNQSGFNAFSAAALPIAPYLNKEEADKGQFFLMPAKISAGGLSQPWTEISAGNQGGRIRFPFYGEENPSSIGELSTLLIQSRPCCFAEGGELILVLLTNESDMDPDAHHAEYVRIKLDTTDTTLINTQRFTTTNIPPEQGGDGAFEIKLYDGAAAFAFGAVVVKPLTDGKVDVTTSYLALNAEASDKYDAAITEQAAQAAAISYGGVQGSCMVIR